MQWVAKAPSNIALIKYMGKRDTDSNIPANPSLSYTLNHLESVVILESITSGVDHWLPVAHTKDRTVLSEAAQNRYLRHLAFLKAQCRYQGSFRVRSQNNFPLGCGLASSASSFAALTKCALTALVDLTDTTMPSIAQQAAWSRQGSGSSCRSFFDGFVRWDHEEVSPVTLPYNDLIHQVIVISRDEKAVSSSDAHKRVCTSMHYEQRAERASVRLELILNALAKQNWAMAYQIAWDEFQDMHQLFLTASVPFSYMNERTEQVLTWLRQFWDREGDGPLVTMDAGPNIHLLYRASQQALANKFQRHYLNGQYDVL